VLAEHTKSLMTPSRTIWYDRRVSKYANTQSAVGQDHVLLPADGRPCIAVWQWLRGAVEIIRCQLFSKQASAGIAIRSLLLRRAAARAACQDGSLSVRR
jgi:hypothetical protein